MQSNGLLKRVDHLQLKRLGGDEPAGLWITSLPWPRAKAQDRSLGDRATYVRALGQWPGEAAGSPRRLLMVADGGNSAPDTLTVGQAGRANSSQTQPPRASAELFARSDDPTFVWERHRLRIDYGGKSIALAMGLRTGDEFHWWEACRMVVTEETPNCRLVEMAGAIPMILNGRQMLRDNPGLKHPLLHKHNWLYGKVLARLHANGVCEIFAHHINSKYVDDGADLSPAVPVVGFWSEGASEADLRPLCGKWDGSKERFDLAGVKFDVAEVARLATPEQPGRMDFADDILVWQPYLGCELFGGLFPSERKGDKYILHAQEEKILRGMARTLRFSLSLSDRSPRIARYLAPAWWYGLCEELVPAGLLPAVTEYEQKLDGGQKWIRENSVHRGFEDGSAPRGGRKENEADRLEPGWEGEVPYAQFLAAYRSGDGADYDLALRSAYHFTDVIIDHAANLARMHGYAPVAFALPMNRVQGPITAFLETGDDYLFDSAEAVIESAFRQHRNAWPRLAVGRDGCFVRGAVMLYRFFANDHFRRIAHSGATDVAHSQKPDGSFGDQGGGSGIHQFSSYVTKPWMGLLATNGVLDYLELFPDELRLAQTVRNFADWLMAERTERDGVLGWGYQHEYNGTRQYLTGDTVEQLPSRSPWHQETLARLLGYCALRFGEPAYLDAWAESHSQIRGTGHDHSYAAASQFLPWLQAKLWQATVDDDDTLHVTAVHFGPRTPKCARILTPTGDVELCWSDSEHLDAPAGVNVTVHRWSSETAAAM